MSERVHASVDKFKRDSKILEKLNIYNKDQIEEIIHKRIKLEYKIRRRSPKLEDFKEYIHYELNFMADLHESVDLQKGEKIQAVLSPHFRRVISLFNFALDKFKWEGCLWDECFRFYATYKKSDELESAVTKYIRLNYSSIDAWCLGAERLSQLDVSGGKKLLKGGVKALASAEMWNKYCLYCLHKCDKNLKTTAKRFVKFCVAMDYSNSVIILGSLLESIVKKYGAIHVFAFLSEVIDVPDNRNDFLMVFYTVFACQSSDHIRSVARDFILNNCHCFLNNYDLAGAFFKQVCYREREIGGEHVVELASAVYQKIRPITDRELVAKYCSRFTIKFDEDFLFKVVQYSKVYISKSLIYRHAFQGWDGCFLFFKNLLLRSPHKVPGYLMQIEDTIDLLQVKLSEYKDQSSFIDCIKLISDKFPLYINEFMEKCFVMLIDLFGSRQLREMISKYGSISNVSTKLLVLFYNIEKSKEPPDYQFLKELFESQFRCDKEMSVDYWIYYCIIERMSTLTSGRLNLKSLDLVYNRAMRNLTGDNVQRFMENLTLYSLMEEKYFDNYS
ncbi:U3 small nucleolar RNA-associated protein 6 [Thelohanellus kitauei]|uniref:U3 small nucleolar RNA-associated protein 6 n=1 Tax=Thelohanellus kitauei TaxID=669202 RepID=A0A0C2J6P1_THEKT|nr:U3 small nucleolar RNA-associated protein 6 [Thelohanellus kitauei]